MSRPNNAINMRLISKVSSLYYHQDLNQQAIAERLHLSRPKVSRLLKQAKDQGIVQITVAFPESNFVDLENRLENKFRLKEVLIVDTDSAAASNNGTLLKHQLGIAAANYLHRTIMEGDVIGVTWGTTLQAMVDALQPKPVKNIHIVQTLGGVGPPEAKAHATDISRRLSQLLNSRLTLLPAPGIVDSVEARKVLLSDRRVHAAMDLFSKLTTAYVGIGALKTNPVFKKESPEISPSLQNEILHSKAVGDIGLNFFDINGKEVKTRFKDLFIGMSLEEFKKIKTVVGIAGGKDKFEAIAGALKGGYIDVLITDKLTGEQLLER